MVMAELHIRKRNFATSTVTNLLNDVLVEIAYRANSIITRNQTLTNPPEEP